MFMSDGSQPAFSKRLALFHNFPTDVGVEQSEWIDVRPIATTTHGGVLEFNLSGANTNYLDLKRTRLFAPLKILHEDGSNLEENEIVGVVNLPLHAIRSQVDISFQQQIVTTGVSTNYPYKAYLDVLLNHGTNNYKSYLQAQLYMPDRGGHMDDITANTGQYMRSKYTEKSIYVDLEGPINMDICQQERFIVNGVQVGFKFWPNRESFI